MAIFSAILHQLEPAILVLILLMIVYFFGVFHGTSNRVPLFKKLLGKTTATPKIDCSIEWLSEYRTNSHSQKSIDNWVKEKIIFKENDGAYEFRNAENSRGLMYQGKMFFFGENFIHGTWQQNENLNNKGTFSCFLSVGEDYIYGHYLGKDDFGKQGIGPWVLAKNIKSLAKAKTQIKDPNLNFKSNKTLEAFRNKYHAYHQTQINGERIWRHCEIDFTTTENNEVLVSTAMAKDKEGQDVEYRVEAVIVHPHFLIIWQRENGPEAASIWVFPFMETGNEPVNFGTIVGHNWDMTKHFGKAILSKSPYLSIGEIGDVNPISAKKLDSHWTEKFSRMNAVPADLFTIGGTPVTDGIKGIYEEVEKQFKGRRNFDEVLEIDILGYTMFSVAPKLTYWHEKGYLKNLKINLMHLDLDFINQNRNIIKMEWARHLQDALKSISEFKSKYRKYLMQNSVTISEYPYQHIPVIHGFRFINSVHFISISSLELNSNFIQLPDHDLFMMVDTSSENPQSIYLRRLFSAWAEAIKKPKRPVVP
jgi:hypothetical protein